MTPASQNRQFACFTGMSKFVVSLMRDSVTLLSVAVCLILQGAIYFRRCGRAFYVERSMNSALLKKKLSASGSN